MQGLDGVLSLLCCKVCYIPCAVSFFDFLGVFFHLFRVCFIHGVGYPYRPGREDIQIPLTGSCNFVRKLL